MADYVKLPEVARRLGVSERTARRMVKAGTLPAVFIGNAYRVSEDDLAAYLGGARIDPGKAPRRSPYEPSFNDALAAERPVIYLEGVLEDVRGRHAWARSVLERESFREPPEEGVTAATTLTMWSTEINALLADVGQLESIWNARLERVSDQAMPAEERRLADELRDELEAFASTVTALRER